jgi:hypothetical protein
VARLCCVRALNARTRVREQVRSWGNLERGGPRSRRAGTLERGGPRSRAVRALERGGPRSSGLFAGLLWWAAGATTAWIVLCVYSASGPRLVLCFVFFAGFMQDSPRFFRGPSWLSPTVAPEHLRVFRSGSRRCWSLLIGRSSLLVANAFPWGRVSGPVGLAPEALHERDCSCRGFLAEFYQRAWYMSQPTLVMFQSASVMHARLIPFAFGASQEV